MLGSQRAAAVVVLGVLLIVFFWTPLTHRGYYTAADLTQAGALEHVAPPGYQPRNALLVDTVYVILPSLKWNRDQLRSGRLPIWNPLSGYGAPQLASYQSAALSLFSLPFYLLDMRAALLVAAFAKLFALGFFTYLFLRRVAVDHWPALVGAVAFMFGGYQIVWLAWQHVGAASALPASLYLSEVALQAKTRWLACLALVAVAITLCAGLLAGHPETFAFGALLVAGYVVFRLLWARRSWLARLWIGAGFGMAALVAAALAAVQLLPFNEYLRLSTLAALRQQSGPPGHLDPRFFPLQAFPDLLGNPSLAYQDPHIALMGNFNEASGTFIGLTALFLAGLALVLLPWERSWAQRPLVIFFAAVDAVWIIVAYDLFQGTEMLARLPLIGRLPVNRSQEVWLFATSCLAALGLQALTRAAASPGKASRWRIGAVAAWGLGLGAAALIGSYGFLQRVGVLAGPHFKSPVARSVVEPEVALTSLLLLVSVLACVGLVGLRQPRFRRWGSGLTICLLLACFIQSGWTLRDLNPTIADSFFFPTTPNLREVERLTSGQLTLRADHAGIPPNSNVWYGLASVGNYDGLGVRLQSELLGPLLRLSPLAAAVWVAEPSAEPSSRRDLQLLGVQYVLTTLDRPFAATQPPIDGLTEVWSSGPLHLFRVEGSLPPYFTVGQAQSAASDPQALAILLRPDFDPMHTVVLMGQSAAEGVAEAQPAAIPVVLERSPTRIRLHVNRAAPGWLVALQTSFPGWTATVDGKPAPVLRANVAFTAVPVPAGSSEVTLQYDPATVRLGLRVSIATALVLLLSTLGLVIGRAVSGARIRSSVRGRPGGPAAA